MNTKELTETLKVLGWSITRDEVGDKCATFTLPDRAVKLIYGVEKVRELQKFGAVLFLTTDGFSMVCSKICGEPLTSHPLVSAWRGPDVRAPEIMEHHIKQVTNDAISWGEAQDLRLALEGYAALPTDAAGMRPVWHLAALVLLGDCTRLKFYQNSFEKGDRLGFVPYVTTDYIDRAVQLVT